MQSVIAATATPDGAAPVEAERANWRPSALGAAVVALLVGLVCQEAVAGVAVVVLWAGLRLLAVEEGPPIARAVFASQWLQITCALFYAGFTGRVIPAMAALDCRPMMLLGLAALLVLAIGLRLGLSLVPSTRPPGSVALGPRWPLSRLVPIYLFASVSSGSLVVFAWVMPGFTQAILALGVARLGLLFLVLQPLVRPRLRWGWLAVVLVGEVLLGLTGFFAGFREPLALAILVVLQSFDSRRLNQWVALVVLAITLVGVGFMWTGIKTRYRQQFTESRSENLARVGALAGEWVERDPDLLFHDLDALVARTWGIPLQARALRRVPDVLPHTDGELMVQSIKHVLLPRLLFPGKKSLDDLTTVLVRKYSGVWVAGAKQGTSIAFGYVAESYLDFGIPLMFAPIFLFGLLSGLIYRALLRLARDPDLGMAFAAVMLWTSLYAYGAAWTMMLGHTITQFAVLAVVVWTVDRFITPRDVAVAAQPAD